MWGDVMGRPEKPLDTMTGPVAVFAGDLRKLRMSAGNPSYREMARVALFSPSVLSSAASGYRLPTLRVTLAFVHACGGNAVEWQRRWQTTAERLGLDPAGGRGGPVFPAARPAPPTRPRPPAGEPTWRDALTVPDEPVAGSPRALASLVRPAQLPVGAHNLVGRHAELARARDLVAQHTGIRTPLVISGQVGVGKTAFAIQLGHELSGELPDGQLYADLGGDAPDGASSLTVLTGFLRALGVPSAQIPADPTQRTGLYRSLLAERRVLVLLDDVRTERQARPLLAHSPHSQILMTSRSRLLGLDGANQVELEVLDRDESVAMIGALAGMGRVRAEHKAGLRLAELCDDLPLALSIVGKKAAAQRQWTMSYIADQLAERSRLLDRLRIGDVSIQSRLRSTYQRMAPWARRAFHYFGREHSAWVTPARLASALWIAVDSADQLLEALLDTGLLYRSTVAGRYGMLPLFRLFAAGQPESSWECPTQPGGASPACRCSTAPHFLGAG